MFQYQKVTQRNQSRRLHPPKTKEVRKIIKSTNSLLEEYEQNINRMLDSLSIIEHKINNVNASTGIYTSKSDAVLYKIDEFQSRVMGMQSALYSFQYAQGSLQSVTSQINNLSQNLNNAYTELMQKVKDMEHVVSGITDISNDPLITRTIEDIKEISDRI